MLRLAALCFKSPLGLAQLKQQSSLVSVPCYIPPSLITRQWLSSPHLPIPVISAACERTTPLTHHPQSSRPSRRLLLWQRQTPKPLNLDINRLEGGDFGRMISKPVIAQVKGIKPDGGIWISELQTVPFKSEEFSHGYPTPLPSTSC